MIWKVPQIGTRWADAVESMAVSVHPENPTGMGGEGLKGRVYFADRLSVHRLSAETIAGRRAQR